MQTAPGFLRSLRFKLLLASLTLLLIPWAGYQYLQGMEQTLREAQQQLLMNRTEIIANLLAVQSVKWLAQQPVNAGITPSLYAFPLNNPPVIDGYADEWLSLKPQAESFNSVGSQKRKLSLDWLAGFHDNDLYLLLEVRDQQLSYPPNEQNLAAGDHLILALPGDGGDTRQLRLGTPAPGWVHVQEQDNARPIPGLSGEWQETDAGYRVELRLPRHLTAGRISVAVIDYDQAAQKPAVKLATSGLQRNTGLAYLTLPTPEVETLLRGLADNTHRYTLLNPQRQVIGRHGVVHRANHELESLPQRLISLILAEDQAEPFSERERLGRLDGPEIRQALSGEGAVYRYQAAGTNLTMLSSAYPIRVNGEIMAALVVEQSSQEILILQQSAIEDLLLISLGLFIVTGGSLLLLASSITSRITRLSGKYQQAVSPDGRLLKPITASRQKDELGQLDASLSAVLKRTKEYSHYLESMASRLAHEFRTPLSVIRSSLENLEAEIGANPQSDEQTSAALLYAKRAQEGTHRLNQILTRLREATRLEQSLQQTEVVETDLTMLIQGLSQGYSDSYQSISFETNVPADAINSQVSPELICQAMDKLVSNAVDFHRTGSPIRIELDSAKANRVTISVINQGPTLDERTQQNLFRSMSSHRSSSADQQPHLGLGLYLVRLIAEFHHGMVWAVNLPDGVSFTMELPLNHNSEK
ncbi:MAG: ATP-binding protein [Candidatus Thiodiazotropha lotti]|nr:ATP-binding protein [Candidatus Thiodiazotropha lotti]